MEIAGVDDSACGCNYLSIRAMESVMREIDDMIKEEAARQRYKASLEQ